jgi:WASH complex subunit FAM21
MAAPPPPPPPPPLPDDDDDDVLPPVEGDTPSLHEVGGPSDQPQSSQPSDDAKLWERPWTLNEIREGSKKWSLASDAGLLLYLKDMSKRLTARTHEIDGQFNGLAQETKGTDIRMNNVFNDFMMLSNIQFVENRIYEENEEDKAEEGGEAEQDKEKDKPEDKKVLMVNRVKEALERGFDVLDNAYEIVQEEVVESPADEDEEGELVATIRPEPVMQLRDPYAERFFPSIIGTQDFYQSERLGLVEYISEGEGEL